MSMCFIKNLTQNTKFVIVVYLFLHFCCWHKTLILSDVFFFVQKMQTHLAATLRFKCMRRLVSSTALHMQQTPPLGSACSAAADRKTWAAASSRQVIGQLLQSWPEVWWDITMHWCHAYASTATLPANPGGPTYFTLHHVRVEGRGEKISNK